MTDWGLMQYTDGIILMSNSTCFLYLSFIIL